MLHSEDADIENSNTELDVQNNRLREMIQFITTKCTAYDKEIKTLMRELIKLLEENVERLERELRLIANMDSIENL